MPLRLSVRVTKAGIAAVDERREKRGWSRSSLAFANAAHVSVATLKRFWREGLSEASAASIFKAVGIEDWQQYVESDQPRVAPVDGTPPKSIHDNVPDCPVFYGRSKELEFLTKGVLEEGYRMLALLGIGGIGKTALAIKLVERLAPQFEGVIWRSMRSAPALSEFLSDLIETITDSTSESSNSQRLIGEVIKQLQRRRILLVFDGWEELLGGEAAGTYRAEYKDYNNLLMELKQRSLTSCVILTSREKQAGITVMDSIRPYTVPGLETVDAFKLLSQKGLIFDPGEGKQLVDLYRGNPLALGLVASVIRDHFGYSIANFLHQRTVLVDESMQTILDQQTCNLREAEQQILCALAQDPEPIDLAALGSRFPAPLSTSNLVSALGSLERRSLVERSTELGQTLYALQPVVRKYVQRSLQCSRELAP